MADQNIQDVMNQFNQLSRQLGDMSRTFGTLGQNQGVFGKALADTNAELEKTNKKWESFNAGLNKVTAAMGGLTSGQRSFTQLNSIISSTITTVGGLASAFAKAIPLIGDAASSILKIGTEKAAAAAQQMIQQLEVGIESFREATRVGAISTFDELQRTSANLNLRFEEYSKLLAANGDILARLGSGLDGTREFQRFIAAAGKDGERLRDEFQRLGVSASEFGSLQMQMFTQMRRLGTSVKEIVNSQDQYLTNLDAISKLTGQQKEDIMKERERRMSEFRYRAKLEQMTRMNPAQAQQMTEIMDIFKGMGTETDYRDLMSLIGTGGRIITREQGEAQVRTQGTLTSFAQDLLSGRMNPEEARRRIQGVAQAQINFAGGGRSEVIGPGGIMPTEGKLFDIAAGREISPTTSLGTVTEEQRRAREGKDEAVKMNTQLANAAAALQTSSVSLQKSATSFSSISKSLELISRGFQSVTGVLEDISAGPRSTGGGGGGRGGGASGAGAAGGGAAGGGAAGGGAAGGGAAGGGASGAGAAGGGGGMAPRTGAAAASLPITAVTGGGAGWTGVMTAQGAEKRVGTWAERNNNPGNLENGAFARANGAVDQNNLRFAAFPTPEMGRHAQYSLLFNTGTYANGTLAQALYRYAPPNENNTRGYIDFLSRAVGVPSSMMLRDMNEGQRQALLTAMAQKEGYNLSRLRAEPAQYGGVFGSRPGGSLVNLGEGLHDEAVVPMPGREIPVRLSDGGVFGEMLRELRDMNDTLEATVAMQRKQMQLALT